MLLKRRGDAPGGTMVVLTIIMVSIILSSGVVLYGTTLFRAGAQQESITISGMTVWVHGSMSDSLSWGAFSIRNNGDKMVSIDKIVVRGTEVPLEQWYPDTLVTANLIQKPMNFTGWSGVNGELIDYDPDGICNGETLQSDLDGPGGEDPVCANAAAAPVGLDPGQGAIIYFKMNNGTISAIDGGATANASVFAGQNGVKQSITIGSKI